MATARIYLTGRIRLEHGDILVEERELAGRQGRLAFAFLASERHRPVSKEVLSGTVQLRLPSDVWIDLECAANAVDEAEGAFRAGDIRRAWSHAAALVSIARRPFLAGEDAAWIEARRARLRSLIVRGLHILSRVSTANGEQDLAVQYAREIVEREPFQGTGYRYLMQTHAQMGNRAEALRVFGRCRELLREELGADPSQETERVFLEILRAGQ